MSNAGPRGSLARRRATALSLLAVVVAGSLACASSPERLPELDRRFYYNLPTPQAQKEFLGLRKSDDRQRFLEENGLWAKWLALPEAEREAAGEGTAKVGFHEFALYMAWGPPADTQQRDRNGLPARIHTFIRCSSGPKIGQYVRNNLDCDGTSDETQVVIQKGIVSEIRYPD